MFSGVLGNPKGYISRIFTVKSAMSNTKIIKQLPDNICRKMVCVLTMVFGLLVVGIGESTAQCPVNDGTSEVVTVNLSAKKDTSWSLKSKREGTACISTNPPDANSRCIRFNVTLNPGADILVFDTDKEPQSSFYSINCGPLIKIGESVCVTGLTTVCISFCKPGNEPNTYTITTASVIKASGDLLLRQNCSGTMTVSGATTATWRSIFPGSAGTYNNYLNTLTGTSVTVTPQTGAPTEIRYEVTASGSCVVGRKDTVSVFTVPPMTVAINPVTPAICNGASVTLTGSVSGGNPPYTYSWNTNSSATSITTSTPAAYTLTVTDNTVGCPAVQQVANVVAAPTPSPPTAPGVAICSGSSATLNASGSGGDTFQWYDAITGGGPLATGASFITPILTANRTYYVQTTVNGCTSTRTAVTVTVNSIPVAPTASGMSICAGTTASLTASGSSGSYQWYNVASGGTALSSSANYVTPTLNANTTYYVQAMNGTCAGPRTAVTVTVNSIPDNPTIVGASICSGNSATLTATAPGGTYAWWATPTGGTTPIGTGIAYNTGTLTSTITYYVETTVNGCVSAGRTAVTVTVNPTPAAPVVNGTSICGGQDAPLTVSSTGDTYRWYNAASAGDLLTTGSSYTATQLNSTTSYYISATSAAGCTGSRTTATVNVTPKQNPAFVYSAGTYCKTGGAPPPPDILGGNTGTFSSTPGLEFVNTATGQIDIAASAPGLYTITFTTGGSCIYSSTSNIRIITDAADATFIYNSPFCVQQSNPLPVFSGLASAGSFTASSTNLKFKNESTGEIDLATSLPGSYKITNTISPSGGCAGSIKDFDIVINQNTTANAGTNLVTCDAQPITLNGSVGGSATNGSWSIVSGTGTFGNASQLSTTFTPTSGQSSVTLQLTSNNPVSPCTVATDIMVVNINPAPVAPTVNTVTICSGNTATLIASAPGGTYNWYAAPSGGSSLKTDPIYTTSVLTSSTTFYVAATSADNCTGPRAPIIVTVNPLPSINSSPTGTVCSGVAQNYSFSSTISGSSFVWSRAAIANITNPVVSGQTGTTSITETLNSIVTSPVDVVYQIVPTANGCTGPAFNYTVTVKPIPATPTATTTGPVCEGGVIQLSSPFLSSASYSWTGPGFTSTLREPQIANATTANGGTYTVRIIVDGCVSAGGTVSQTIKTKPAAPVVSNSSPVCIGETFSLNTPIVIGASYTWTGPNGFTSTEQQPSILNAQSANAGNYALSISVDGCVSNSSTTNVTVNLPPAQVDVTSTGPVCITEELRLIAQELQAASYTWSGPNGFVANSRIVTIASMNEATAGAYQVIASVAGCASVANSVDASLKPTPAAPTINPISLVCENETLILSAASVTGASYNWTGPGGFISNTQSPAITNVPVSASGNYSVNIVVNGCRSANNTVAITVNPTPPAPQVSNNGAVCEGNTLQLNAVTISGATYSWTGPSGFTSSNQNPVINNALQTNAGTYTAAVTVNGCRGPGSTTTAIVNPLPGPVNIASSGPACEGRSLRLTADSVTAGSYSWTGPNGFSSNARSVLLSSMNNNNTGEYRVAVSVAGCTGVNNSITTILKPTPTAPVITVPTPICQNSRLNLGASIVSGASYQWTGPNGFDSKLSSPVIDSVRLNQSGIYSVNITVDGCVSNDRSVNVTVIPEPTKPQINSNSPLCLNDSLQLTATAGGNASFRWFSTNGFSSTQQNPQIASVNYRDSGQYAAFVLVNGCVSDTAFTKIEIDQPAVVNAGNDQVVCANNAVVQLNGSVSGGSNTGIWTSNGTGRFGTRTSSLTNSYIPSSQDTANGTVTLVLSSTNNKSCRVVNSSLLVRITDAPFVDIGNNPTICANDSLLAVNAQFRNASGIQWTSNGTGTFDNRNALNTHYVLSSRDQSSGSFRIYATTTGNGSCVAVTDEIIVNLAPVPLVDVGKDLFIFENTPYTFNPQITGNVQAYQWTPATFLNNASLRNPVFRGNADQNLTLRVVSTNGCVATDEVFVTVLKPFPIPNVFSPNGDGVHDTWVIPELDKYPNAVVSVFDRYGRRVFFTEGYKRPWDGTFEGKPVAIATYYYIIEPRLIPGIFSGSVTILK